MLRRMNTMNWKLRLAGVLVACACGLIAWKFAWATPAVDVFNTLIAEPVLLEELDVAAETDTEEIELKTRGFWECRVVESRVPPGGDFGWHSHPGPKFVMITAGTLTKYEADGSSADYPAGTGFVDPPGAVHTGGNEGDVELKVVAFLLLPAGAPLRIDEPAPLGD